MPESPGRYMYKQGLGDFGKALQYLTTAKIKLRESGEACFLEQVTWDRMDEVTAAVRAVRDKVRRDEEVMRDTMRRIESGTFGNTGGPSVTPADRTRQQATDAPTEQSVMAAVRTKLGRD